MRRRSNNYSRKTPRRSRTISVYGDPDRGGGMDSGVLYRCWNCGQINNSRKQALGGADAGSGVAFDDYSGNPLGASGGTATMGGIGHTFIAQINDSNGDPVGVTNAIKVADTGTGCALCGTLNWRGDY